MHKYYLLQMENTEVFGLTVHQRKCHQRKRQVRDTVWMSDQLSNVVSLHN